MLPLALSATRRLPFRNTRSSQGRYWWPLGRNAAKHAFRTNVFVNFRPVHALTITDDSKVATLGGRGIREPPRPRQGHADDAAVDQIGRDGVVGNPNVANTRFG